MPLRRRMAVATALAVGVAVALATVVAYAAVRGELRGQVDGQLRAQAELAVRVRGESLLEAREPGIPALPPRRGGAERFAQVVPPGGAVPGEPVLPVDGEVRAVAAGRAPAELADVTVSGEHLRVITAPVATGGALQIARSLESVDAVLARLRWILLALVAGGIALAALLGRLAARHLVAPVARVTEAARHIARTEDLGRRIAVTSRDEVGELAGRFNAMLDAVESSVAAQRQLVADASHELRTPVAALRTNIEVLAAVAPDRRLVADVEAQVEELGALVGDLMELARGDRPSPATEDVRLDALVSEALERARRHAPGVEFRAELEPAVVEGAPDRLARAVNNLLDNAGRHSGRVEVRAGPGGVTVRDHGDGIDPDDLPHLFDRFYRGAGARERPGTGLGLAIVRQVAEQHGGRATAVNAPGGGARFDLHLPAQPLG